MSHFWRGQNLHKSSCSQTGFTMMFLNAVGHRWIRSYYKQRQVAINFKYIFKKFNSPPIDVFEKSKQKKRMFYVIKDYRKHFRLIWRFVIDQKNTKLEHEIVS